MHLLVIGAGAWGTALAIGAARPPLNHQVTLWARNAQQVHEMQRERVNTRYLPHNPFPDNLSVSTAPLAQLAPQQSLIIIATPMAGLRECLAQLQQLRITAPVAWLCKGFEATSASTALPAGWMPHEVCLQVAPDLQAGALNGPSFAQEVAQGLPTCLVAASPHSHVRQALIDAFHSPALRIYANNDIVGVEVGGAVKNVMAIAAGLCDGLNLGLNARAALLTRGLAEMSRLGTALGAQSETFMGLSGLGDLILTATGDLSRNRKVGLLLAAGMTQAQAVDSLGHVAEGVYSARTVVQRAQQLGVDMPIASTVVELLDGRLTPQAAVHRLMSRHPKDE